MIVLDTNVLSEALKPAPAAAVLRWWAAQAPARAAGRPIWQPDAMIAAIARSRHAAVAPRNTSDFQHCGIKLLDPWSA